MKFFNAFKTFVVIMIALAVSSVSISFFFPTVKKEIKKSEESKLVEEQLIDTWFPIPVTEIELQGKNSKYKYWVVLENGLGFYTNEKMNIGDPGAWINNTDSLIFRNPQKN